MAKILLAEDDDSMRRFLALALGRAGHEVVAVGNGIEALEAVRAESFDLLLADIVMPGMDGIELARHANDSAPELRVMFITGFAGIAMSRRSAVRHNTGILSKPFHLRQLVDEVDKMLAS
jgi:two-component system cell cycle response regulator CpdR